MRIFPRHLMIVALALSGASVLALTPFPAMAQKSKDKQAAEAPKMDLSKAFQAAAAPIQKLMDEKKFTEAQAAMPAAKAAVGTADDNYIYYSFLLRLGIGLGDQPTQKEALVGVLASGKASPAEKARFSAYLGEWALGAGNYAEARTYLQSAVVPGQGGGVPEFQLAETYFGEAIKNSGGRSVNADNAALAATGLPILKNAIAADLAAGGKNAATWADRGFTIARATKSPEVTDWAVQLITLNPSPDSWKDALQAYQIANVGTDAFVSLDVMRLMRRAGAMTSSSDFAEYLEFADSRRRPVEVLAVLDEGTASGVVNSADTFIKEQKGIAESRISEDRASLPSSEKAALAAKDGAIALPTADALLGYGEYSKAQEFAQLAIDRGGVDMDRANMILGIALADQGKYAEAKAAWDKVGGVRGPLAKLWSAYAAQKAAPAAVAASPAT